MSLYLRIKSFAGWVGQRPYRYAVYDHKNRGFEIIALISKSIIVLRQVKSETSSKSTLSLAVVAISAYYKYVIFVKWLSILQRLSQSNSGSGVRARVPLG